MPDNENIMHIAAVEGLAEQMDEHLRQIEPEGETVSQVENQNYEKENARKTLNFWRTHELHSLQGAFE